MVRLYNSIINRLSFYHGLYKMRRWLNTSIDRPEAIESFPESHPRGFIKKFRKRRISIVESYVKIISFLESDKCLERLEALRLLADHILHSRSLKMPLNTARVQMALMKEAVKNRDDKRVQLERLRDFSVSSFGQPKYIRKYLNQLGLIEVPETGEPLKDLEMGWDSHVHDNSSYGRKTPTQLLIDAFIKGISRLTVVYNALSHKEIIHEAIEAGRILGITVNVGLEFCVGEKDQRFYYIYRFPHFDHQHELDKYLEEHREKLDVFMKGLEANQETRIQAIEGLVHTFNLTHLAKINRGYQKDSIYYLEKIKPEDIEEVVPIQHATRMHLGEVLFMKLQPVMFNRVLYLKAQKQYSDTQFENNEISRWEYMNTVKKYEDAREKYREMNPDYLRLKYFSETKVFETPTVFNRLQDIFDFSSAPGDTPGDYPGPSRENIKFIHPLDHGLNAAVLSILEDYRYIGHSEIYNMHESVHRDHHLLEAYARFIFLIDTGKKEELKHFLKEHDISFPDEKLDECAAFCCANPIIPTCGSDSTGRASFIPGMGFILRSRLVKKQHPEYLKSHYTLPSFISQLIAGPGGKKRTGTGCGKDNTESFDLTENEETIISMGKSREMAPSEIGDEIEVSPIPTRRAWYYLNPVVKDIFYIMVGFIPAFLTVGWEYALIWFGITSVRNAITDIISGRGYRPKEWHVKNIDFDNLAHSLFWTGFSVPLLGFVKDQFDVLYPLAKSGYLFEFARFFFICMVNGLYLASHNTLRGFDKATIRANFFRSVLAWPFAAIFAPLGNVMLVPSIVQAKFWSDFVAGLIEGSGKFNRRFHLRKRDLDSLLPYTRSDENDIKYIAILDLLYFFRKDPRTHNSLRYIFFRTHTVWRRLARFFLLKSKEIPDHYDDYNYLKQWFSQKSHYFQLTDFILENYKHEQVIYLTQLIADTFDRFYRWLLKHEPGEGKN